MKKDHHIDIRKSQDAKTNTPEYVSPAITTYTEEQILEQIGPVHAVFEGSPGNSV